MTQALPYRLVLCLAVCSLVGCGRVEDAPQPEEEAPPAQPAAQDQFWSRLSEHCSRAFAGVAEEFPEADDWLDGAELVMHVRECSDDVIRISFNVGDDRSRTWVLTRHADAIELRHDHRHEDGSPGDPTMYGAVTQAPGTAERQEFPRETDEGVVGGWAIEVVSGERFTYGTVRAGAWRHRLEFDLSRDVPLPSPSWGHEEETAAGLASPAASSALPSG